MELYERENLVDLLNICVEKNNPKLRRSSGWINIKY